LPRWALSHSHVTRARRLQVMKLIEENRRKNEAKRAAQSARNAEITAAFEARQGMAQ